jgi:N-hydroxyarylamine O-acetyltransferase
MNLKVDTGAYFERIGYSGPQKPTPEVLKELHLLHPRAIAFENLNPFMRLPVPLDAPSIQKKLLFENRGGYCFEQNSLFRLVLEELGFKVKGLAARVRWNVPEDRITPRGHMLLLVETEGRRYISDVGFGGMVLTAPLLLKPDIVQETPHEPFQLKIVNENYVVQANVRKEWKTLYSFNLSEHLKEDYEITNWYLCNHPKSHFVTGLMAARPDTDPARRYTLNGNLFSVHRLNGETKKIELSSVGELKEILGQIFGITLPDLPETDIALKRIVENKEITA